MIYFDNNATTKIDPLVIEALIPLFHQFIGNPSSIHRFGQKAKGLLTEASFACAHFFGVQSDELIFTSGATESLNFLISSLPKKRHIITSSLEHAAVLEPLKNSGSTISYLMPLPGKGSISLAQVQEALRDDSVAIILSLANNETGVITEEIHEIATVALLRGIPLIVDGVAYLGKAPVQLHPGIAAACFSSHKIHGPTGAGLTIIRKNFKAIPFILGGPQQRGLRAGTENLPAILGFAKALEIVQKQQAQESERIKNLRDFFEKSLMEKLSDLVVHGKNEERICNTSNIAFLGVDGETLLMKLDMAGVAASHGSACSSGTLEPSRILLNMGIMPKIARSSLRFSLSRFTTQDEIEKSIDVIVETVTHLRSIVQKKMTC